MKKFIVTLSVLLAFVINTNVAQAQASFEQGTNMITAGIGFGKFKNQTVPPLSVAYERSIVSGLFDYGSIGIGGQFDVQGFDHTEGRGFHTFVGARVSWHYEWLDNLDTYVSAAAGLQVERNPELTSDKKSYEMKTTSSFMPAFTLGARYLFTRHFGVFSELSNNISYFKVGLTFNL